MLICGLKISHDASIAVIDGNRLQFCVEIEKLDNNRRYSEMGTLSRISDVLRSNGLTSNKIDSYVVDGWHDVPSVGERRGSVRTEDEDGRSVNLTVNSYNESTMQSDVTEPLHVRSGLQLRGVTYDYTSYKHAASHIFAAYCTSPFAAAFEPSYVLIWDGGQYPRLYLVDPARNVVKNLGHIFGMLGTIYGIMGHYFGPYKRTPEQLERERVEQSTEGYFGGHSIAGKLMSYIALGQVQPRLLDEMHSIYRREFRAVKTFEHTFMQGIACEVAGRGYSDADVLMTVHDFVEKLLIDGLRRKLHSAYCRNLCFGGGSALNIKWNSAIRDSGLFDRVWVPPFPNDSGNSVGAACCDMVSRTGNYQLDWSVYSGPEISVGSLHPQWHVLPLTTGQLARLLADTGEPVVFLNGRAELGPRALGNRSILASPTSPVMKTRLNEIKKRESFRPVAPICLEEDAPSVFDPGTPDPYMLFNHTLRDSWSDKVPAVRHLDGTARLQTISRAQNAAVYEVIAAYRSLTGIPLLCNTSANSNGSGFFPNVESAMRWGGANYIFCDNTLYRKESGN